MEPIYIDDENKPPINKLLILSIHRRGYDKSEPGYFDGYQYTMLNGTFIQGHIYAYTPFPEPAVYRGSVND